MKDLDYELDCLKSYLNLAMLIKKRLESKTTLEEDLLILEGEPDNWKLRMCVIYRSEKKKIIRSQIDMILYLINVVRASKDLAKKLRAGDFKLVDQSFKSIYM